MHKNNEFSKAFPIHNNLHYRGILRKMDRRKMSKLPNQISNNCHDLMLDLIKSEINHAENHRQSITQRISLLSSIRCRNLRNRNNEARKKQINSVSQKRQLQLQPFKQIPIVLGGEENKNRCSMNLFVCRKTIPLHLNYSRSKTSRSHYVQRKQEQIMLPDKGLVGYQISSNSPMNRKISIMSNEQ